MKKSFRLKGVYGSRRCNLRDVSLSIGDASGIQENRAAGRERNGNERGVEFSNRYYILGILN